jgi:fibronectin type 3 domain-containing protein
MALAVGGTDFNPSLPQNWSAGNAPGTLASATGYIPEMVWNDSCTNVFYAQQYGYANPLAFCNAVTLPNVGTNPYLQVEGGGGGLSNCISQNPDGGCAGGYAPPAWQSGVLGIDAFAARALPDVSMLATSWLICSYEAASTPCNPQIGRVLVAGGTSAAAPAVSAILALLDESKVTPGAPDGRQGLIAPVLYALAALEYGSGTDPNTSSLTACNAGQGAATGPDCVFHDITVGTNAMPCSVGITAGSCVTNGGDHYGIIESAASGAYAAAPGYDLASGLGSLDAGQLVLGLSAPTAPTGLVASAHGNAISLSWVSAARATSYNVYAGTAAGHQAATAVATGISGTAATLTSLNAGQAYYLTVAGVSSFGVSAPSNEAQAMTAPAAPAGVHGAAGIASITVSWDPSLGASAYTLYEGPASSAPTTPAVSAFTATSYTVAGLTAGTTYAFAVAAMNSAGTSPTSAAVAVTVPPAAPGNLTAVAGNHSVNLSWDATSGASSYSVLGGTGAGQESSVPMQAGIAATRTTIDGLTDGSTYYFRVVASNAGGESGPSNENSATPSAPAGGGGALDESLLAVLLLAVALRMRGVHRLGAPAQRTYHDV